MSSRAAHTGYFALRLGALSPVLIGPIMAVIAPAYFGPMVQSFMGIVMLLAACAFVAVGYAIASLAIRLMARGRVLAGAPLCAASILFGVFPALWIVLLGPAVLILMRPS